MNDNVSTHDLRSEARYWEGAAERSRGFPAQWERYLQKAARPDGSFEMEGEVARLVLASPALDAGQREALAAALDPESELRSRICRAVSKADRAAIGRDIASAQAWGLLRKGWPAHDVEMALLRAHPALGPDGAGAIVRAAMGADAPETPAMDRSKEDSLNRGTVPHGRGAPLFSDGPGKGE